MSGPAFYPVPGWALAMTSRARPAAERITPMVALFLGVIAYYERSGEAYPSMRTLGETLGVDEDTITVLVRRAKAVGILEVRSGSGRGNRTTYRLIPPSGNPDQVKGDRPITLSDNPDQEKGLYPTRLLEKPRSSVGETPISHPFAPLSKRIEERDVDSLRESGADAPPVAPLTLIASGPGPKKAPTTIPATSIREVFEHWRAVFRKNPRTQLDRKREARIRWAIATYGSELAKRSIDGYATSAFHMGDNNRGQRYDDVELFFRDAARFEKGLALASAASKAPDDRRGTNAAIDAINGRAVS